MQQLPKPKYTAPEIGGLNDWIVETGQTNGWTWVKWASGIAKAWREDEHTAISWLTDGEMYYANPATPNINYPPELFTEIWYEDSRPYGSGFGVFKMEGGGQNPEYSAGFWLYRATAAAAPVTFKISRRTEGLWKPFEPPV